MNTEEQCRNIYRDAFNDPDTEFENKLFKHCFKYSKVINNGNEVAAMLFALPCTIKTSEKSFNAYYIYAAATLKKYRGQGFMKRLIQSLQIESDSVLFLKPASHDLIKFYEKLGFVEFSASLHDTGNALVVPDDDFKATADELIDENNEALYTAMYYYKEKLNLNNLWFPYTME